MTNLQGNPGEFRKIQTFTKIDRPRLFRKCPSKNLINTKLFLLTIIFFLNLICGNNLFLYMTKLTLHLGSGKIVSTTLVPRAFFRRPVGNFRVLGGTPKKICSGNMYVPDKNVVHTHRTAG